MKILVTGGAGYIGSFMTKALLDKNYSVTVFDNLERGHSHAIDKRADFIKGDIKNVEDLEKLFLEKFDAVIHFAGLIAVGESEENPKLYYENNVLGSKRFFEAAVRSLVKILIFSSSAAVYGNPTQIPISETHPKNPTSEYGRNKLEAEEILTGLRESNPEISFSCLRYFNASGAALDGSIGEEHQPETHIIPKVIESLKTGSSFNLFGDDYQTHDGSCIRDYIHVLDLVEAHLLSLEYIKTNPGGYFFNVGTGRGYSNREIVSQVEDVTGEKVKVEIYPRRKGDPQTLIADPSLINQKLHFSPKYSDLETIVKTAWDWHSKHTK